MILPLCIVLRYQKHSETRKRQNHEIFVGDKIVRYLFVKTLPTVLQKFCTQQKSRGQKRSKTSDTSRIARWAAQFFLGTVRQKVFDMFW